MSCPLHKYLGVLVSCYFGDVDTKELEALNLLHYNPNHLLCLDHVEGEVVVLAPPGQVSDILPIGCLVVVGDQASCVIGKCNDGVGVVLGRVVMSEQGVQEGTEHVPLRGHCLEDQHSGCVVTYPYHLGGARPKVQDPVAEGGVPSVPTLVPGFLD